MVVSEIRSIYQDENDLLRTVIKRIWEEWVCTRQAVNSERRGHTYDDEGEVQLLDGEALIIRE